MAQMALVHNGTAKVTIHNGFTSTVSDSFSTSGRWGYGCAWDGANLIVGHPVGSDTIHKYSGLTPTVLDSFSTASWHSGASGVTWDGTNLIQCGDDNLIRKHSGFSATVIDSILPPGGASGGLGWFDGKLVHTYGSTIYILDGFSTTQLDSFQGSPDGGGILGASYDGTNLLHANSAGAVRKVYKNSGVTSTVLDSFSTAAIGGVPCGIAWILNNRFTVSMQYEQAGGSFVNMTSTLGEVGGDIGVGTYTAYWDNPSQDRPNVEVSDQIVRINANPDIGNEGTNNVNVTSATQLSAGDGTGSVGDVKVEYEIT